MFADPLFASTHLLARPVGPINPINMFNSKINSENIIAVSEEDLKEEQRQAMEKAVEEYKQLCLKSFSLNKSGQVIQKQDLPLPRQVTFDSNPGKLQEMVNSAVNHALINHSNVRPILFIMLWFELSKKDKRHRITLGLPITNQSRHLSILHRLPRSLWVQKLLPLQYRQAYLIFNLHRYDQIRYYQDEFSLI